jgi:putative endonuclease
MHYVYILRLINGDYYVGETNNLKSSLDGHLKKNTKTTARFKPTGIVFYAAFKSKIKALKFEKYLKSSSGFAFRNKRLI